MLYGSLYKVFKQLSKQKGKNGNNNQYDEIIIPKIFLKILLNNGKIPKVRKSSKNNNNKTSTTNKDDIVNLNNFINEEIDNISPKIKSYIDFQKRKSRGITPLIKSHYINNPNLSLPKIKIKKKISILSKKIENIKNTDKKDFLISEAILKQMKKTYYLSPFHTNKGSLKADNSINKNKRNDKNIDGNYHKRNNSNNKKTENENENNKIFEGDKNNEIKEIKEKNEGKNGRWFNKINIISNNNNLMLSKNKDENLNEILNKANNKNNGVLDNYWNLKNKSCSRLFKFIRDKKSFNAENCEKDSNENNSVNIKNHFEQLKNNTNNYLLYYDRNKSNLNNHHIQIKKNFYDTSQLFRIKPKIQYKSKTMNFYAISVSKNFKDNHNNLDYINQIINKNIIDYSLNTNISSKNEIFYYRVNKMYRNQFTQYMSHRLNWEIMDNINTLNSEQKFINFEWRYYSHKLNYKNYKYDSSFSPKKLKIVNLFEKNYEIGNKKNMFINLINYCDKANINVFDIVPFTIVVNNSQYIEETLDIVQALIDFVETNKHFKRNLVTNKKYNELFWFDKNYDSLTNQYVNINKNFISTKNYWIIKPTDLYQGKCIEISNSYEEIVKKCRNIFKGVDKRLNPAQITTNNIDELNNEKLLTMDNAFLECKKNFAGGIKKKIINSKMYCSNEIIIQKYLDNPLLYKKRKFDIRCFVLLDCNMNLFFCREGHLKGSSESYNLNNTNKFIHITNHSLQKKSNKFEMYELGNEMSYQDFKNFMESDNIPLEKFEDVINQMKLLIQISFKAVANKLLKTTPVLCFEIFGYDFILDNDFKLWILEINNNPGLGISSPLIEKLIPRMLDDAFRLTIDKIFNTRYSEECINENGNYKSKYKLDGFKDDENIFEFLCNIS